MFSVAMNQPRFARNDSGYDFPVRGLGASVVPTDDYFVDAAVKAIMTGPGTAAGKAAAIMNLVTVPFNSEADKAVAWQNTKAGILPPGFWMWKRAQAQIWQDFYAEIEGSEAYNHRQATFDTMTTLTSQQHPEFLLQRGMMAAANETWFDKHFEEISTGVKIAMAVVTTAGIASMFAAPAAATTSSVAALPTVAAPVATVAPVTAAVASVAAPAAAAASATAPAWYVGAAVTAAKTAAGVAVSKAVSMVASPGSQPAGTIPPANIQMQPQPQPQENTGLLIAAGILLVKLLA